MTGYGNLYKKLQQVLNKSDEYFCSHEKTAIFLATHVKKHIMT